MSDDRVTVYDKLNGNTLSVPKGTADAMLKNKDRYAKKAPAKPKAKKGEG